MNSENTLMSLSEALKVINASNSGKLTQYSVNLISDQLMTQFKIFLKARLRSWNIDLTFDDEKYNGFLTKCFEAKTENRANINLMIIDSYSLLIHPNLRSSEVNSRLNVDLLRENSKRYLDALETFFQSNHKVTIIQFFNLKNEIFNLQPCKEIREEDIVWNELLLEIYKLTLKYKHVHVFDSENLVFNQVRFVDNGEYLISENASKLSHTLSASLFAHLTGVMPKELKAEKKLLISDLDNTFWGGILGDDGIENLHFSETSKGKIFWLYQKFLNFLHSEGIVLAVCSKNNHANVIEAFNKLQLVCPVEKFSLVVANWDVKSQNIKSICENLNILPESTVFVDDNPLEIEEVKSFNELITCVQFPNKIGDFESFLLQLKSYFSKANRSTSIQMRHESYRALNEINMAREGAKSTDQYYEYLKSVDMKLEINPLDANNRQRAFELLNKTNQFNFHGRRYSEEEFKTFENFAWTISLKDKFANHGIIGVVLLNDFHIEQFVLSCRVFSRHIEDSVFESFRNKIKTFSFKKTEKNNPALDFLLRVGFIKDVSEISQDQIRIFEINNWDKLIGFPGQSLSSSY